MTKITVDKALIEQAIEAMEGVCHAHGYQGGTPVAAVTALRAALAEPAVEPVAHATVRPLQPDECERKVIVKWVNRPVPGPLYASPPALAEPAVEPTSIRDMLIQAAAMAIVLDRKGNYQSATKVADAVLESERYAAAPAEPDVKDCLTTDPLISTGAMSGMVDAQVQDLWPTKSALVQPAVEPVKKGLFVDLIAQHPGLAEELAAIVIDAPAKPVVEPVFWEWRRFDAKPYTVTCGQWSEWKRVEPRNRLCTVEDSLNEFRGYIANGHRYELRALYTSPPPTVEPAVEPVAWLHEWADGEKVPMLHGRDNRSHDQPISVIPLYASPPPPAEVPLLSDFEISDIFQKSNKPGSSHGDFARAIEKAVRQKAGLK